MELTLRRSYERSQEQDRDQDNSQDQPELKEVEREEEDEEEFYPSASFLPLTPLRHSSSDFPHAFTSAFFTHGPTAGTSTYSSASISNITSVEYREGNGVDTFGQTLNPSMVTSAADSSADNWLSVPLLGPGLATTGGLSVPDQTRLAQSHAQQDATDLQGWSVVGGNFAFDDTIIDWDNWQVDFGGVDGASPGGGGPSGATRSAVRD